MGFIDDAKDKMDDMGDDMKDKAHDATEDSKDWADDAKDKLKEGAAEAGENINAWMDKSQEDHGIEGEWDEGDDEDRMSADELEEKTHGRDL